MHIKLPSLHDFSRDAKLLIAVTGILAVSFFGIVALLRGIRQIIGKRKTSV